MPRRRHGGAEPAKATPVPRRRRNARRSTARGPRWAAGWRSVCRKAAAPARRGWRGACERVAVSCGTGIAGRCSAGSRLPDNVEEPGAEGRRAGDEPVEFAAQHVGLGREDDGDDLLHGVFGQFTRFGRVAPATESSAARSRSSGRCHVACQPSRSSSRAASPCSVSAVRRRWTGALGDSASPRANTSRNAVRLGSVFADVLVAWCRVTSRIPPRRRKQTARGHPGTGLFVPNYPLLTLRWMAGALHRASATQPPARRSMTVSPGAWQLTL